MGAVTLAPTPALAFMPRTAPSPALPPNLPAKHYPVRMAREARVERTTASWTAEAR
jgi:hypothetical protein